MIKSVLYALFLIMIGVFVGIHIYYRNGVDLRKATYVAYINTPSHGNKNTKKALDIFNEMSYNKKAVKYEGKRPVFIIEGNPTEYYNLINNEKMTYILGVAYDVPFYCLIIIQEGLSEEVYIHTLYHEYIHCYRIDHVCEKCDDLMSARYVGRLNEQSIYEWAQIIGKLNK